MDYIKFLEWDTKFFKKNTGRFHDGVIIDSTNIDAVMQEIINKKLEFVYYFQDASVVNNFNTLFENDFDLIDVELIFEKNIEKSSDDYVESEKDDLNEDGFFLIEDFIDVNIEKLRQIFKDLSKVSRFYEDGKVDKRLAEELYMAWFDNCINKSFSDYFYIIGGKKDPKGFLVCQKMNDTGRDTDVDLTLLAIDSNSQGKNFAKKILAKSLNDLYNKGFRRHIGKVHLSNKRIVGFYSSLGRKIISSRFIFHYHKKQS